MTTSAPAPHPTPGGELEAAITAVRERREAAMRAQDEAGVLRCDAALAALVTARDDGPTTDPAAAARLTDAMVRVLEGYLALGRGDGAELVVLALARLAIAEGRPEVAKAACTRLATWGEAAGLATVLTAFAGDAARHQAAGRESDALAVARIGLDLAMAARALSSAASFADTMADLHERAGAPAEALLCRHHAWRIGLKATDAQTTQGRRKRLAQTLQMLTRSDCDRTVLERLAAMLAHHHEPAFAAELHLRAGRLALLQNDTGAALAAARAALACAETLRDETLVIACLELEAITHRKAGDAARAASCEGRLALLRLD
jgi:hypothetical protein